MTKESAYGKHTHRQGRLPADTNNMSVPTALTKMPNSIVYVDRWGNAYPVEHSLNRGANKETRHEMAKLELKPFQSVKRKVVKENLALKYRAKPTRGLVDAALKAPTENY